MSGGDELQFTLGASEELRVVLPPGESIVVVMEDKPPIVINVASPDTPVSATRERGGLLVHNEGAEAHELAIPNLASQAFGVTIAPRGGFDLDASIRPAGSGGGFEITP